ncbi:MAG: sigma 54-interacting transcriptional regulator, partial [Woeseiaceae bacterium]
FWLDKDADVASVEYVWSPGEKPFGQVSMDQFPVFGKELMAHRPVRIDDVDRMPDEAGVDRVNLQRYEPKSFLALPMVVGGDTVGGMTCGRLAEQKAWSDQDVEDLTVFAELFANFVLRLKSRRALDNAMGQLKEAKERLEAENVYLRNEIELTHGFDEIVGRSDAVLHSLQLVEQVAPTKTPVLILGETGTGKELIARAIHELSERCDRPLVKVNCAALPANLIESELFGHEKGAFTGADGAKRGRFDLAHGSTLFLDEIGEIPLELQAKLLRVLQEGEFDRLGGSKTIKVDARLIVATNRDLAESVRDGQFRSDLYYRINTFPITLPPLRDRGKDIDMLAQHFVRVHAPRLGREVKEISADMMQQLRRYTWPGNVRELEGVVQRALISSVGPVLNLAAPLAPPQEIEAPAQAPVSDLKLIEREHIVAVLEDARWKISGSAGAAARLGIPPSTLRSKMKKLSISRPN